MINQNNGFLNSDDKLSNLERSVQEIYEKMEGSDFLLDVTSDCARQTLKKVVELEKIVESLREENRKLKDELTVLQKKLK